MQENENTIILLDEEGNEVELELIITMEKEGTEYALLKNLEDESDDMFAFRIDEDGEGDILTPIEDDDEIEMIQEMYNEIIKED
ncbi:DUF1292 domain-containing protein [Alkalibaculum sp. M08DMB]|uniref:UPF0473 protein GC105_10950 n=1 Tax=Alkalibaculum sporogenes TaxID=2655001 RepID=A0A6A7KA88_9FIRM|nr:DUF1292 domain-containing protein [Alkalibaculum sporogenes]MPW26306.1 DUF1292 domain-containing protein [Alkalibaculum sporogenes]